MKHNQMRQVVFPILAAFIWGTAFVAQDMCADAIGAFAFNASRYFIAVLALLVVILISDKLKKDKPVLSPAEKKAANRQLWLGGLGCELGHMFPVFFGFKGGKGILSGGTLVWLLDWRVGLIAWGLFAALWLLTKYVSLGSVCAAASMPVTTFFFCGRSLLYTALAVLIAALVIWCHRENITRLLHHQERKFQWHTGTPKEKE